MRIRQLPRNALGVALAAILLFAAGAAVFSRSGFSAPDLVFDNLSEIQTLDPATANGQKENRILIFLFEGLTVAHPETLEPVPGVAHSWTVSPDGKEYTFHLREDARWSNGDPVTAEDFVYSWRRVLDPQTGCDFPYLLGQVVGAEKLRSLTSPNPSDLESLGLRAPDSRTFVVSFEHPVPYFLETTFLWPLLPVHSRSLEAWKKKSPQRWRFEWIRPENLIGNGPYKILDRRVNDRFLFEKNPHYWNAANVKIARIDAIGVESATTRLNLFEAGLVDWTQQIPIAVVPEMIARDRQRPAEQRELRNEPFLANYWYYCNVTRPPLDDRRVRLALAHAIDRERIVRFVTRGGQIPAHSVVPPLIPGYETARGQEFDPETARRYLREAGFPQGRGFPAIEILYDTNEMHRDIAEVIQDEWRKHLGIEVKLLNQEWKSYLDSQITHRFDVSRGSWVADYRDPNTFLEIFGTGNGNNRSGFSDPEYDRLLRAASIEPDPEKRFALLRQMEEIVLREAPVIPLFYYVSNNLVKSRLKGWHHNALDMHFPQFWSLDEESKR